MPMRYLLLTTILLSACSGRQKDSDSNTPPKGTMGTAHTASMPSNARLFPLVDTHCASDTDCALHHSYITKDGRCCHSCTPRIGSRKWVERVQKICDARSHDNCPQKKCAAFPELMCRAGQCVTRPAAKKPATPDAPYSCRADADCIKTVVQGALNKAWFEVHRTRLLTGRDGCAAKGTKPPRCINGICTGISHNGKPDPACTRKKIVWNKRGAPLP